MDEKRAKTLEALSAFIQSQKALLSHTQSDIERLRLLRADASKSTELSAEFVRKQLDDGVFSLSDQSDLAINITKEIDWSVYKSHDPTPFKSLSTELRRIQAERNQPSKFQKSELSELQRFVKHNRQRIVDPVLKRLATDPQYAISSDEEDPEEIKKELEREKIRELKKRKVNCMLTISGNSGVFVRRDQDESADVDVTLVEEPMETDPPPCSVPSPPPLKSQKPKKKPPEDRPKRAKSDTYKLAWSVEEQHLLERLLEEIPDGESRRWAKISRAMNGRRTARQVASRVQKYFEKLRKFGVDIKEIE